MADITIPGYYDRFDSVQNYKKLLVRASLGAQSSEINELQDIQNLERQRLSNLLWKNGSIVTGGKIQVSALGVQVGDCTYYLDSYYHNVDYATFNIGLTETVNIGVNIVEETIDEVTDPTLRDPATGTKNYGQPGAARLRIRGYWRKEPEVSTGKFFSIYTFVEGLLVEDNVSTKDTPLALMELLAKYDRNSNGSYVVNGMEVLYITRDDTHHDYILSVQKGSANVEGYNTEFTYDHRFAVPYPMTVSSVSNEPILYTGAGDYPLRWSPIAAAAEVNGTKQVTESIVRGLTSGGLDVLGNTPVMSIISITQGGTTYHSPADFVQSGDFVSWASSGAEPSSGSTYDVTYNYEATQTGATISSDYSSIHLSGYLNGTTIYIDYTFYLPRIDRILLSKTGEIIDLQGDPHRLTPLAPKSTVGLSLAIVYLIYGKDPIITIDYFRTFRMSDIQRMYSDINDIKFNLAQLFLRDNVRSIAPSVAKRDIYVESFDDYSQVDLGLPQNGLIVNSELIPNVIWNTAGFDSPNNLSLPYTEYAVIDQSLVSSAVKINNYDSADVPPGTISIYPTVYRWMSDVTYKQVIVKDQTTTSKGLLVQTTSSSSVSSTDNVVQEMIPPIEILINSSKYNVGEPVSIFIDNVFITNLTANARGEISNTFIIPTGIYTGSKEIRTLGTISGVTASTVFVATAFVRNVVETIYQHVVRYDPIAETFVLPNKSFITSVDLMFNNKPNSYVDVYLCDVIAGMPDRNKVLAKTRLSTEQIFTPSSQSNLVIYKQYFHNNQLNGWEGCEIRNWGIGNRTNLRWDIEGSAAWFTGRTEMISEPFNSIYHNSPTLSFDLYPLDLDSLAGDGIEVSLFDGSIWRVIDTYWATDNANRIKHSKVIHINNDYRSSHNRLKFRMLGDRAGGWYNTWGVTSIDVVGTTTSTTYKWTKCTFDSPVLVNSNEDYAVVVQTTDNNAEICIAELGKYDSFKGKWISQQSYTNGVLLESSNGTTWTAQQSNDLTFRVNVAQFYQLSDQITLPIIPSADNNVNSIDNATDYILLASEITPDNCTTKYSLLFDDVSIPAVPYQHIIRNGYTGDLQLGVSLGSVNQYLSPQVEKNITLAYGVVELPTSWISKSFSIDSSATLLQAYLDAKIPLNTTIDLFLGLDNYALTDGYTNKWTLSESGTSNYHYNTPMDSEPEVVQYLDNILTRGTLGSLSAGQYAFGNNDSLSSNTLYVRLPDSTDPDTKSVDTLVCLYWFKLTQGATVTQDNGYDLVGYSRAISSFNDIRLKIKLDSSNNQQRPVVAALKAYTV